MAAIYHPKLDRTIEVPEQSVPIHRGAGWIPVGEIPPPADDASPDADNADSPPTSSEAAADTNADSADPPARRSRQAKGADTTSSEETD